MDDSQSPYRVAVKPSAREGNEAVHERVERAGETLTFDAEADAVAAAKRLAERGATPVRIQRAAPQDATGVDGYLVADPERWTREPRPGGSASSGLTFDVSGNQYGALGEALVLTPATDPPALRRVAREDLDLSANEAERLRVRVDRRPEPVRCTVPETGERKTWRPDCRAVASLGDDGRPLAAYWCEIKTGEASFQRDQRAAMAAKARDAPVLKIRVDVKALPDRYTVRAERVSPSGGGDETDGATAVSESTTRDGTLDEFR